MEKNQFTVSKLFHSAEEGESLEYRQLNFIGQGALTNSKRPECFVKGVYPTHVVDAKGVKVKGDNGKEYIDFICGLGTNLLGYGHEEVNAAAFKALEMGSCHSLPTPWEIKLTEALHTIHPNIEQWRFLKTGSEACNAAIRIARAATGKMEVCSSGYHGWADQFISLERPAAGISINSAIRKGRPFDYEIWIDEPVELDATPAHIEDVKSKEAQVFVIHDEIVTGFRHPRYTATNYYHLNPDMICLGKAMGNGWPIAAVGGDANVLSEPSYFVSSTYAGEVGSLAASCKVIDLLKKKYALEDLWAYGGKFRDEFNSMGGDLISIAGYNTRGRFKAKDDLTLALFFQESCRAGLLVGPSWFFAFPHIGLMDTTLSGFKDVITRLKTGSVKLEGEMPQKAFAQKVRENGSGLETNRIQRKI